MLGKRSPKRARSNAARFGAFHSEKAAVRVRWKWARGLSSATDARLASLTEGV